MNWNEARNHLTEQLAIIEKLTERFGEEVIESASSAKLAIHKTWMKDLSTGRPMQPSDAFRHSAFTVTSAEEGFLKYEVLEESDERFAVKITKCKYAEFYIEKGRPDIGYAMHCALDFGETEAFSAEIMLKRAKTLMQGDDYCDHCYDFKKPQ
jgi:hypothetical protein